MWAIEVQAKLFFKRFVGSYVSLNLFSFSALVSKLRGYLFFICIAKLFMLASPMNMLFYDRSFRRGP